MKYIGTLAATVASLALCDASLRGSNSNNNNDGSSRRRYQLEDDEAKCVLYLKGIEYGDHRGTTSWSCEFPIEVAKKFGGLEIMDIEGVSKQTIGGAVSGEAVLSSRGAYVEHSVGSDDVRMVIPDESSVVIESLSDDDPRHHKQRRTRRRRSLYYGPGKNTFGSFRTLVVRVVDGAGRQPDANPAQLRKDIFDDNGINARTQFAACSQNQMTIEPVPEVGDDGVVTITIPGIASPPPMGSYEGNDKLLAYQALQVAEATYGGPHGLQNQYDFVMFCLPPGTGNWAAYAYVNRWDSYYNNQWCSSVSSQMHELGHNLNLGHSGEVNSYDDESGMMGYSYPESDWPRKCYNAAKNYQLGWYDLQKASVDPLSLTGEFQSFVLNGVDEYRKDGSSNGELVALRIGNAPQLSLVSGQSISTGVDYYVGYNRRSGANIETNEGGDKITVYEKSTGGPDGYGESTRVADLEAGQYHILRQYQGTNNDVYIIVASISEDGRDATIVVSLGLPTTESPSEAPSQVPSASPTVTCVDNNDQSLENNSEEKVCAWAASGGDDAEIQKRCQSKQAGVNVFEICPNTCKNVGLGSCAPADFFGEGCRDDPDFRYEGDESQSCANWVSKSFSIFFVKKKCAKTLESGGTIADHCQRTCAGVGLGPCTSIPTGDIDVRKQ